MEQALIFLMVVLIMALEVYRMWLGVLALFIALER